MQIRCFPILGFLRTFSMVFWGPHKKSLWQKKFCYNLFQVKPYFAWTKGRRTVPRHATSSCASRLTTRSLVTHNTKSCVRSARKLKGTHVFINEDLTKTRATIAWEARTLKRERKISDTWTRDGVIFVKKVETGIQSFTTQRAWKAFLDNQ